jgi:hypothetical protein
MRISTDTPTYSFEVSFLHLSKPAIMLSRNCRQCSRLHATPRTWTEYINLCENCYRAKKREQRELKHWTRKNEERTDKAIRKANRKIEDQVRKKKRAEHRAEDKMEAAKDKARKKEEAARRKEEKRRTGAKQDSGCVIM